MSGGKDWQGPPCFMCEGTGARPWKQTDGVTRPVRCPACNGHGREAS